MEDVGMKTMSALESQGENIERWEEVVDGINQVRSPHEHIFYCSEQLVVLKNVRKGREFLKSCLLRKPVNRT
jgi:hypothetical protein